jgi:tripartite-type tricarboxylate transporter receptor subunit TctC
VRSPPDGYTLLLVNAVNAINVTLFTKLNFDFAADIVPVAGIIRVPLVMQVNPGVPAKTVPAFIAYAKANPGKINMASAGTGSTPHVAGELFKMMASGSSADFGRLIAEETEKWRKVVKFSGAKAE